MPHNIQREERGLVEDVEIVKKKQKEKHIKHVKRHTKLCSKHKDKYISDISKGRLPKKYYKASDLEDSYDLKAIKLAEEELFSNGMLGETDGSDSDKIDELVESARLARKKMNNGDGDDSDSFEEADSSNSSVDEETLIELANLNVSYKYRHSKHRDLRNYTRAYRRRAEIRLLEERKKDCAEKRCDVKEVEVYKAGKFNKLLLFRQRHKHLSDINTSSEDLSKASASSDSELLSDSELIVRRRKSKVNKPYALPGERDESFCERRTLTSEALYRRRCKIADRLDVLESVYPDRVSEEKDRCLEEGAEYNAYSIFEPKSDKLFTDLSNYSDSSEVANVDTDEEERVVNLCNEYSNECTKLRDDYNISLGEECVSGVLTDKSYRLRDFYLRALPEDVSEEVRSSIQLVNKNLIRVGVNDEIDVTERDFIERKVKLLLFKAIKGEAALIKANVGKEYILDFWAMSFQFMQESLFESFIEMRFASIVDGDAAEELPEELSREDADDLKINAFLLILNAIKGRIMNKDECLKSIESNHKRFLENKIKKKKKEVGIVEGTAHQFISYVGFHDFMQLKEVLSRVWVNEDDCLGAIRDAAFNENINLARQSAAVTITSLLEKIELISEAISGARNVREEIKLRKKLKKLERKVNRTENKFAFFGLGDVVAYRLALLSREAKLMKAMKNEVSALEAAKLSNIVKYSWKKNDRKRSLYEVSSRGLRDARPGEVEEATWLTRPVGRAVFYYFMSAVFSGPLLATGLTMWNAVSGYNTQADINAWKHAHNNFSAYQELDYNRQLRPDGVCLRSDEYGSTMLSLLPVVYALPWCAMLVVKGLKKVATSVANILNHNPPQ